MDKRDDIFTVGVSSNDRARRPLEAPISNSNASSQFNRQA